MLLKIPIHLPKKILIRKLILLTFLFAITSVLHAQNITQIKSALEKTNDPINYVKLTLKKRYKIDTIRILSTSHFLGIADSLAYNGKTGKVYGPFKGQNILLKILGKAPNTFYRASQILLDTSIFKKKFADSLGTVIISRIQNGSSTFESMARTYSSDATAANGGDMGWFIRGIMIPQFDKAITSHKKGDVFKIWTTAGLNIIEITENPKQDNGFALLLRVFL